jgi:hypothetical protein
VFGIFIKPTNTNLTTYSNSNRPLEHKFAAYHSMLQENE